MPVVAVLAQLAAITARVRAERCQSRLAATQLATVAAYVRAERCQLTRSRWGGAVTGWNYRGCELNGPAVDRIGIIRRGMRGF